METNTTNGKLVDVTDLSDAAFGVFLAVKAGEECVEVEHLSHVDRVAVCAALGVEMPSSWRYYSTAEMVALWPNGRRIA